MGTNRLNVSPVKSRLRGLRSGLASLGRRLRPPSPRDCSLRPDALPVAGGGGASASLPPAPAAPPPPLRPLAAPCVSRVRARPPFRSLGLLPSRNWRPTPRYAYSRGTAPPVGKLAPSLRGGGGCVGRDRKRSRRRPSAPPLANCRVVAHTHPPASAMCPAPSRIGADPNRPSCPL
jgi:hypothetical protein